MSDKSGIEWTDATWNPVSGCTKVSAGCKHCYAERMWKRLSAPNMPYEGREFTDIQCHPDRLDQPLRWKKPRRIFVNSMSDLFHEDVPTNFIYRVWSVMVEARFHTFQVLTKRPERAREILTYRQRKGLKCDWNNIWLGVSVEDQDTANERIPPLLATPAAVRFVSCEPLLGPVDLREIAPQDDMFIDALDPPDPSRRINWIIVGGESGPKARPMHPDWARSIRDQCSAAGVPFFFKQWGEFYPAEYDDCPLGPPQNEWMWSDGTPWHRDDGQRGDVALMRRTGKRFAGRILDGREWSEYPV